MSNPLLEQHSLPPFKSIEPAHVVPAIEELIRMNRESVAECLGASEHTYASLARVLDENDDRLLSALSPVRHLASVMNSPELREAYEQVLPLMTEYGTEMRQNPQLFEAYKALAASDEYPSLPVEDRKALDNTIRDFKLTGIDLPPEHQQRFGEISQRLSELSNRFRNNVLDATMAYSRHITDEGELAGLPDSAKDAAREAAAEKQLDGWLFTLDIPSYLPVMAYCENRELRREMYEAFSTRASEVGPNAGEFDNSALMVEILQLRQEQARLLGFRNYAEQSLATKMARTPDEVLEFLRELASHARTKAQEEFVALEVFARAEHGTEALAAWDVAFYAEKLKQDRYDVSDDELRPYFPAPRVIEGMFETVRRLFDLDIRPTDDIETWHPEVTTYNIHKGGELIARFYLDPYARANKQGGAWMDDCRVRRRRLDGEVQLPVAYLTCNFSRPTGGKPALLTHDEVVTLFHEFGHGLHHMLTRVECGPVSGINGVAWDAVELPSQFLENWCWQPEALSFISGHFETGEPLPEDLLGRMLAAKNFNAAMATVRQLEFALFDFRLHVEYSGDDPGGIQSILDEVRDEVAVVPAPDFNRFQHGFGHIFGGGYAAGYYSYKWAEVLSADAFARFADEGIFNRQTGERFLESILERGGSRDAMELFVDFRGREPDVMALLRQDGIAGASA